MTLSFDAVGQSSEADRADHDLLADDVGGGGVDAEEPGEAAALVERLLDLGCRQVALDPRDIETGVKLTIVNDRTNTIRASIHDVQFTLILSVVLVVLVVFVFLRTVRATIIAAVALPLSLIATFGVMWFCGFALDNLSLMALTIGTGFVVDDAIVMIENIVRHIEEGEGPLDAALRGAREIGFTVISLTLSLIAVFIPLLFMTGLVGRMFREFALTLTIAVVVSAIVSLTLTPMMCSRTLRAEKEGSGNAVTRFFKPKAVIPCHYGSFPIVDPSADRFVAALDGSGVQVIVRELLEAGLLRRREEHPEAELSEDDVRVSAAQVARPIFFGMAVIAAALDALLDTLPAKSV